MGDNEKLFIAVVFFLSLAGCIWISHYSLAEDIAELKLIMQEAR